jgi:4-diphosphocytidyl-2-C-methyl-D-erythritol kinase
VARDLGADVPFLLAGGTATATGRGDVVRREPSGPPVTLVLVLPPLGTQTAAVYARVAERRRPAPPGGLDRALDALRSGVPARIRDAHHNDLAEAALRAYPDLLRFTARAERLLGRPPCMTGSGSTLFDVPDPGETEEVVARLASLPGRREVVRTDGS